MSNNKPAHAAGKGRTSGGNDGEVTHAHSGPVIVVHQSTRPTTTTKKTATAAQVLQCQLLSAAAA